MKMSLHHAALNGAPFDVMKLLLDANPEAATAADKARGSAHSSYLVCPFSRPPSRIAPCRTNVAPARLAKCRTIGGPCTTLPTRGRRSM